MLHGDVSPHRAPSPPRPLLARPGTPGLPPTGHRPSFCRTGEIQHGANGAAAGSSEWWLWQRSPHLPDASPVPPPTSAACGIY